MATTDARTTAMRFPQRSMAIGGLLIACVCFVGVFGCSPTAEEPSVTERGEPDRAAAVAQREADDCLARIGGNVIKGYYLIAATPQHPQGPGYVLTIGANITDRLHANECASVCHITSREALVRVLAGLMDCAEVVCSDASQWDAPNGCIRQISVEETAQLRTLVEQAGGNILIGHPEDGRNYWKDKQRAEERRKERGK